MNYNKLKKEWTIEENYSFKGWDFTHITDRWENEKLLWNYDSIVRKYLKKSHLLLDMGTGGGEFLLSLNHTYHLTYATEGYLPNFELCKKTLEPLGVKLEYVDSDNILNFSSNKFDVVINRHEEFDLTEVNRVLKSGGYFITQQVGIKNGNDLTKKVLGEFTPVFSTHHFDTYLAKLKDFGYEILFSNEMFPKIKFYDVGALVYYAKIIEWEFPNFSVENHFDNLCKCQHEVEENGYVSGTEHRFIIVCRKP